jgi:hypothetical protein
MPNITPDVASADVVASVTVGLPLRPPAEHTTSPTAPSSPDYLSDGNIAFPASVVAQWPEGNRKRMTIPLYLGKEE